MWFKRKRELTQEEKREYAIKYFTNKFKHLYFSQETFDYYNSLIDNAKEFEYIDIYNGNCKLFIPSSIVESQWYMFLFYGGPETGCGGRYKLFIKQDEYEMIKKYIPNNELDIFFKNVLPMHYFYITITKHNEKIDEKKRNIKKEIIEKMVDEEFNKRYGTTKI